MPVKQIVAAVDLDMPLLLYDFTDVVAFGADHSTVARTVAAGGARRWASRSSPDPMPEQTIFVRSDHYRFVRGGVPAILLMTGYANGGKAKWDDFFGRIYHQPNDDLAQPINWNAGARYAELNYRDRADPGRRRPAAALVPRRLFRRALRARPAARRAIRSALGQSATTLTWRDPRRRGGVGFFRDLPTI